MRGYYTIASSGPIACLGGINAPITTPTIMKKADVLKLINAGHDVYKHNPAKKSEKVKVTFDNINNIKFGTTAAQATEDRILQKAVREEKTKYVAKVHTKSVEAGEIPQTPDKTDEPNGEGTKKYEKQHNGKHSDKKEKISKPDEFQKS